MSRRRQMADREGRRRTALRVRSAVAGEALID
jgi:hypothetical protein